MPGVYHAFLPGKTTLQQRGVGVVEDVVFIQMSINGSALDFIRAQ